MRTAWTREELIKTEEHLANLFKAGKINCPLHLSGGNEDQLIAIFSNIGDKDWVFSTHRSHYHYLLKGGDRMRLINEILGEPSGMCGGKGRSMHLYDTSINFYTSAIIGGTCAPACGVGLALKKAGRGKAGGHVWCFVGDGCEDSGHFYEAARFAYGRQLPVTFIVEDNDLSIDSTKCDRWRRYLPVKSPNIIGYSYVRTYPHVGVGKHVSF